MTKSYFCNSVLKIFRISVLFGMFIVAGCGIQKHNVLSEMEPDIMRLTSEATDPVWQSELEALKVDIMELMPGNRLLIGTLKLETILLMEHKLVPSDFILYDSDTGNPIWKISRSSFTSDFHQKLLAFDPLIIIGSYDKNGIKAIYALDPENGDIAWQELDLKSKVFIVSEENLCLIVNNQSGTCEIRGLNIHDGTVKWTNQPIEMQDEDNNDINAIQIEQGLFVACNKNLYCISEDGKQLWKKDLDTSPNFIIKGDDNNVYINQFNRIWNLDINSGNRIWEWEGQANDSVSDVLPADNSLLVVSQQSIPSDSKKIKINALETQGGQLVWQHSAPRPLSSWIKVIDKHLYYSTIESFVTIDVNKGVVINDEKIPLFLQREKRLSDVLIKKENSILLVREIGFAAFDPSGQLLYSVPVKGGIRYTSDFSWGQYEDFLQVDADEVINTNVNYVTPSVPITPSYYRMARNYQTYINQITEPVLQSGSAAERSAAITSREVAARGTLLAAQADASTALLNASAQFANSLSNLLLVALSNKDQIWYKNLVEWTLYQAEMTSTLFLKSIRDQYYIRPIYDEGWRLAIIDIVNKKKATIFLTPPNEVTRKAEAPCISAFALDKETSRVYATGLGIDFNRSNTYQIWHPVNLDKKTPKYKALYPSLFCFDLTDLTWYPIDQDKSAPVGKIPSEEELKLILASRSGDVQLLNQLLDSGVSPDAADHNGKTALMYAVQYGQKPIVAILVDRGADIYLKDQGGWSALDYEWYPPFKATGHNPADLYTILVKAHKKRSK